MILVVADDLLFRSKISSAAKAAGVVVRAATSPDAAMDRVREDRPSLILLDLDGGRPQPFEVLKRLAADDSLRAVPTMGFVSHVHARLVQEARALGIGQVLARSAFVAALPDILAPHAEPDAGWTGRPEPTYADVERARGRLSAHLTPTPLLRSEWLSDVVSADISLKVESLQPTRAFKIRGALNALLTRAERPGHVAEQTTIVTASAGNHGRAVAYAADLLGFRALVFTPADAPRTKKAAIQRHGAELRDECRDYDAAESMARDYAAAHGLAYLSPYNDADVIAGAGTAGLEILEAMPGCDVIVVPLGGGGLASGVGLAVKSVAPRITVVGVEVEASAPFTASLAHGAIQAITPRESLADGLVGNLEPDSMTFDLVRRYVDRVVTVTEKELRRALRGLAGDDHLIAEGAGAVATAAVLARDIVEPDQRVCVVLSGANIDLDRFTSVVGTA